MNRREFKTSPSANTKDANTAEERCIVILIQSDLYLDFQIGSLCCLHLINITGEIFRNHSTSMVE